MVIGSCLKGVGTMKQVLVKVYWTYYVSLLNYCWRAFHHWLSPTIADQLNDFEFFMQTSFYCYYNGQVYSHQLQVFAECSCSVHAVKSVFLQMSQLSIVIECSN